MNLRRLRTKMLGAGVVIGLVVVGYATLSARADMPVPDALDASFREWLAANHLSSAELAVMKNGRPARSFGYGGWTADQPEVVASLSKAITAVCIARLVDAGRLSFTTTLGDVLTKDFEALGEPVDPRFKTITIEQLLTHRSGLGRDSGRPFSAHHTTNSGCPARAPVNTFVISAGSDPSGCLPRIVPRTNPVASRCHSPARRSIACRSPSTRT